MAQLISELWSGLRDAGFPEVMLYLPDNSAARCHWDETALIGEVRVALLADQDRKIVRILPVDSCTGIGIASPKGVDPSGYKPIVHAKLLQKLGILDAGGETTNEQALHSATASGPELSGAVSPPPPPPAPPQYAAVDDPPDESAPAPKPDSLLSRWGVAMKPPTRHGSMHHAKH
jgi:hypothetical protein